MTAIVSLLASLLLQNSASAALPTPRLLWTRSQAKTPEPASRADGRIERGAKQTTSDVATEALPSSGSIDDPTRRGGGLAGTYRTVTVGAAPSERREIELTLRADATYQWSLISGDRLPSTFHGTWHRDADRVIFDTTSDARPVVLTPTRDPVRHAEPGTIAIRLAPQTVTDHANFTVSVDFGKNERSPTKMSRSAAGALAATATDRGAVQSFAIDGKDADGGGHYVVPVPDARRDDVDFTLLFSSNAIDYEASEVMPPLTIEGRYLKMDHGLTFVRDGRP